MRRVFLKPGLGGPVVGIARDLPNYL